MNALQVVSPDAIVLRQACNPVSKYELRLRKTQYMIEAMLDFVYGTNNKGETRDRKHAMTVGLSANQVGINRCISIVDMAIGHKSISDIQVLINPRIVWKSNATLCRIEGCVNLPSIWGQVSRAKKIKVEAMDRSGNELLLSLSGWPAILLQHEIDHLKGGLFIDKLVDPTKALLVKDEDYPLYKKNKIDWKKFVDVSEYLVKI